MDRILVLYFVVALPFCLGERLNEPKVNIEDKNEKSFLNREISKLLKERLRDNEEPGDSIRKRLDDPQGVNNNEEILRERTTVSGTYEYCFNRGESANYKGFRSTTISGRTCQHWNDDTTHNPSYTPEDSDDLQSNYCRDLSGHGIPWCYTTDPKVRWENCHVPVCDTETGCYESGKSHEYSGRKSITISGRTCQNWDWDCPHSHIYHPSEYTEKTRNTCQDPSGAGAPWCYTTDPDVRWEYCDIPVC